MLHNVPSDLFLYSDNGVSLVHFDQQLNTVEKIGFKVIWLLTLMGITYFVLVGKSPFKLSLSFRAFRLNDWTNG